MSDGYYPTMGIVQRRFLLRSRWTAVVPLDGSEGERHFEVVEAPHGPEVVVRAVLTHRTYRVAIAALEDPSRWLSDWRQ